jgi:hypothetical protein
VHNVNLGICTEAELGMYHVMHSNTNSPILNKGLTWQGLSSRSVNGTAEVVAALNGTTATTTVHDTATSVAVVHTTTTTSTHTSTSAPPPATAPHVPSPTPSLSPTPSYVPAIPIKVPTPPNKPVYFTYNVVHSGYCTPR